MGGPRNRVAHDRPAHSAGLSPARDENTKQRRLTMKLLTKAIYETLLANGSRQKPVRGSDQEIDFRPVVKLFTPDAGGTWLLTELDPDDPDIAFGLCDLGMGFPELGSVRISELTALRGPLGLPVERDLYFTADKPLSAYTAEASKLERINA
jgi:hypothetical protein